MGTDKIDEYFNATMLNDITDIDSNNIGIKNIIMRLKYLYKDNWSIKAYSEIGFGTTVEIIIPTIAHGVSDANVWSVEP